MLIMRQTSNAAEIQSPAKDRFADSLEPTANDEGPNRHHEIDLVKEIAKQAVLLGDLREFLRMATDLIHEAFDYQVILIWSVSPWEENLLLMGSSQKPHFSAQKAPAVGSQWKFQDRTFWEILSNSNLEGNFTVSSSQITIPIRLRGKSLGFLLLEGADPSSFPRSELKILEDVAALIASTFDKFRLLSEAHRSSEYLQSILKAATDIAIIVTDLQGYIITASHGAQLVFQLSQEEICGSDILALFMESEFQRDLALHINNCSALPFKRGKLVRIGAPALYLDIMLQCVCGSRSDPIGFLCVVRDATQDVMVHRRLESLSITDELTGLYNRRHFWATLRREVERGRRCQRKLSLCLLDLDGLKAINDNRGHLRGDHVLKETAALLQLSVRSADTTYRYAGDEFAIIMPETALQDAGKACRRIQERMKEHFQGEITASIGIAEWFETMRAEDLVAAADKALYCAKANGKACIFLGKSVVGYLLE